MKFYLTLIFTFLIGFSAFGQTPQAATSTPPARTAEMADDIIKVDTLLLNVPVIGSDPDGRSISGLTKEDFILLLIKPNL